MLDLRFVRENPETVRRAMRAKMMEADLPRLENLLRLDEEHRLVRSDLEEKQARRNADSRLVGEMKRRGEDDPELMARLSELSGEVKRLEETERSLEQQIGQLMLAIP
ncbi:MAG TPA: serine--tRNA ligase, partial [Trueperaceae bacterium]|nr:serine--tRNA ligase [Trueperaceae bacterium]